MCIIVLLLKFFNIEPWRLYLKDFYGCVFFMHRLLRLAKIFTTKIG